MNFTRLVPDLILDSVENFLGARCTGRVLTLNSLENRVYEIELEEADPVVVKFYRPKRWSESDILEEHDFVLRLHESEIPVIVPLSNKKRTIGEADGTFFFAVYPKIRGRINDEIGEQEAQILGRYLARIHNVGATVRLVGRATLGVKNHGREALDFLKNANVIDLNFRSRYIAEAEKFISMAEGLLMSRELQTIHGDCHLGNVLWLNGLPTFLDFDDFMTGPIGQDFWMLPLGENRRFFEEAYGQLRPLPNIEVKLAPVYQGLRLIHYARWIAMRLEDPIFPTAFPQFGSIPYWEEEWRALSAVNRQAEKISSSQNALDGL